MTAEHNGNNHLPNHHSPVPDSTLCRQLHALIPAYSIGATDPTETSFVEANLIHCPDAVAELSEYLVLADELLYVPLPMRDPGSIAEIGVPTLPKSPIRQPARVIKPSPKVPARKNTWGQWWMALAGVLALVLFGGFNLFWLSQIRSLQQEQRVLQLRLEQAEIAQSSPTSVNIGQVHHRDLLPNDATTVSDQAHATIIWNSGREVGSLYVTGLPALPTDKRYQLWVVRDGKSLSLGLFNIASDGTGTLVFEAAEPIEQFQHIGISEEPAAGSPMPTTPHLVLGTI